MTDLCLAIAHHFLVFVLAGLLAAEFAMARRGMGAEAVARLARIDGLYGGVAGAVILVGVARVIFGVRGWEYYVYYPVFWMKMGAFVAVGLLSVAPTRSIAAWRRKAASDAAFVPSGADIDRMRRFLNAQIAALGLILVFAAAMARGVGY